MYNSHNNDIQWAFQSTTAARCTVILSGTALRLSLLAPRRKIKKVWERELNHRFLYGCPQVSWSSLSTTPLSVSVSQLGIPVITFTAAGSQSSRASGCGAVPTSGFYFLSLFSLSVSDPFSLPLSHVYAILLNLYPSYSHTYTLSCASRPHCKNRRANIIWVACQQPPQRPMNRSW